MPPLARRVEFNDRFFIVSSLLITALILGLHLSGYLLAGNGLVFTGSVINTGDASVYLAAMRQGASGQWLFDIQFTPEAVTPRFQYLFYLLLGRLAAVLPGGFEAWWHAARVFANLVALFTLWWAAGRVRPDDQPGRRFTWLFIVASGGAGWLALPLGRSLATLPDLGMSEWTMFFTLLSPAHYSLGLALTVGLVMLATDEASLSSLRRVVAGWLLALMLAVVYPYAVPIAAAVLAAAWLISYSRSGRWRRAGVVTAIATAWLPLALYYGWFLKGDAYWWQTHVAANRVPAPDVTGMLLGLGLPGLLAIVGIPRWLRQGRTPLIPTWLAAQVALLFVPVPYHGRFALALMVPVGLLAANWLLDLVPRRLARPAPALALLLLLVALSSLFSAARLLRNVQRSTGWAYYVPHGEIEAARWLGMRSRPDDVILVYHQMGNLLPRYAPGRVFIGQSFLTAGVDEKARLVNGFWHEDAPPGWREALLAEWNVAWIYLGSFEAALVTGDVIPPAEPVYDANGVRIFAVTPRLEGR